MAFIVENDVLVHAILKEFEASSNVTIQNNSRIESVLLPKDGSQYGSVTLSTGENYSCDLMVRIRHTFHYLVFNISYAGLAFTRFNSCFYIN